MESNYGFDPRSGGSRTSVWRKPDAVTVRAGSECANLIDLAVRDTPRKAEVRKGPVLAPEAVRHALRVRFMTACVELRACIDPQSAVWSAGLVDEQQMGTMGFDGITTDKVVEVEARIVQIEQAVEEMRAKAVREKELADDAAAREKKEREVDAAWRAQEARRAEQRLEQEEAAQRADTERQERIARDRDTARIAAERRAQELETRRDEVRGMVAAERDARVFSQCWLATQNLAFRSVANAADLAELDAVVKAMELGRGLLAEYARSELAYQARQRAATQSAANRARAESDDAIRKEKLALAKAGKKVGKAVDGQPNRAAQKPVEQVVDTRPISERIAALTDEVIVAVAKKDESLKMRYDTRLKLVNAAKVPSVAKHVAAFVAACERVMASPK